MLESIDLSTITDNSLLRDYLLRKPVASTLFSHDTIESALQARREGDYPRAELQQLLRDYHSSFVTSAATAANIERISNPDALFVTTGQQAGLMGGPLYTLYKIITTIKLAKKIEAEHGLPTIPLFWLASEDHDFDEINRASRINHYGDVSTTTFDWDEIGRPLRDLPFSERIQQAADLFMDAHHSLPHAATVRELFNYRGQSNYCHWCNQIWLNLFAAEGLLVVEPHILNGLGNDFFERAIANSPAITTALQQRALSLAANEQPVALDPAQAGQLFTFDNSGIRTRLDRDTVGETYSTDAALRPIFLDALAPTVAHVLGPGELSYHAMLQPLYDIMGVVQPHLHLRESFTIINEREHSLIKQLNSSPAQLLRDKPSFVEICAAALNEDDREGCTELASAAHILGRKLDNFENATGLENPIDKTIHTVERSLSLFKKRLANIRLNQMGIEPRALRHCLNTLWPQAPQERLLSAYTLLAQYGPQLIETLLQLPLPPRANHHIITLASYNHDS